MPEVSSRVSEQGLDGYYPWERMHSSGVVLQSLTENSLSIVCSDSSPSENGNILLANSHITLRDIANM